MSETKKKESTGNQRYSRTTVGVEVQITYLEFKVILCAFVFVSESIQTDRILTIESL